MVIENGTQKERKNGSSDIEFRVMASGEGRWYWEVVRSGREVILRGLADTEPAACQEAGDAARDAGLIP